MSYAHASSSFATTHPLRRSAGLIFVVALHLAVIAAIQIGTVIRDPLPNTPPSRVVARFEKPIPPPLPTNPVTPATLTTNTFTIPMPQEPVIATTQPVEEASTIESSRSGGEETLVERTIVTARIDPSRPLTQPAYPPASRRNNEQGRVELMLYILANGKVGEAKIVQSSGHSRLDDSAVREALRSWKFIPQQENGNAVPSWQRFAITFRLDK